MKEERKKGGAVSLKDAVRKFMHTSGLAARESAGARDRYSERERGGARAS